MNASDRVVIKTEGTNQVVYKDGEKIKSFSHYEDYAYTDAQEYRRDLISQLAKAQGE